jgi:hypothetical protein
VFVGSIIFAGVAVLCVVAFVVQQKRRREYEERDE